MSHRSDNARSRPGRSCFARPATTPAPAGSTSQSDEQKVGCGPGRRKGDGPTRELKSGRDRTVHRPRSSANPSRPCRALRPTPPAAAPTHTTGPPHPASTPYCRGSRTASAPAIGTTADSRSARPAARRLDVVDAALHFSSSSFAIRRAFRARHRSSNAARATRYSGLLVSGYQTWSSHAPPGSGILRIRNPPHGRHRHRASRPGAADAAPQPDQSHHRQEVEARP